jgi:4-diphosphocytidyl-2-C-methyl-D-erythritol kinase
MFHNQIVKEDSRFRGNDGWGGRRDDLLMLTSFAPAKVNLFLHVTGRRDDGYHLLDSLAVFPAVGDELSVVAADELSLRIEGKFGARLAAEDDNLVLRAARALAAGGTGAMRLVKNLPVASGIGGGSADAAAALRVLARFWNLDVDPAALGAGIGADVPVCVSRRPAVMQGIGEILHPAPALPAFGMVLINPGVAVPTPAVFKARQGGFSKPACLPAGWDNALDMAADLSNLTNDLETPAITIAPIIADVLASLKHDKNCLLARMSGSGATCFGIYETLAIAQQAITAINQPNWWSWAGGLYEPAPTDI